MEDFFVSSYGMPTFIVLVVWATIWKGLALWRAAKKNSRVWYIILLVFNTLGILEIIYLYLISSAKSDQKSE